MSQIPLPPPDDRRDDGRFEPCGPFVPLLVDALSGHLDAADRERLDTHLATCAVCRAERAALAESWELLGRLPAGEPSPALDDRFAATLAAARQQAAATPRTASLRGLPAWAQLAAAALLLACGFLAGQRAGERAADPELAALRQEVRSLTGLVSLSLLDQGSASTRLQGVAYGRTVGDVDPGVLEALLATATGDPSANVRLAALDALASAADRPALRSALLDQLPREPSPLVQIGIVDLLLDPRAVHGPAPAEAARLLGLADAGEAEVEGEIEGDRADEPALPASTRDYLRRRLSTSS